MELLQLTRLCREAAVQGAHKALAQAGTLPLAISKAQAFRQYGRSNVERWIAEGLISAKVPKNFLDRLTLERVAHQSNRTTYLPVANR